MVKCKKCRKDKPLEEFQKRTRNKIGRLTWCKSCVKEKKQEQSKWFKTKYKISPAVIMEFEQTTKGLIGLYKPHLKCCVSKFNTGEDTYLNAGFSQCTEPVFFTKAPTLGESNQVISFCRKHYNDFVRMLKIEHNIKSIK